MTDPTPTSHNAPDSRDNLMHRLTSLRQHVAFPPTPDLAASVRAELDGRQRPPVTATPPRQWGRRRPFGTLATFAVILVLVATLAVPTTRAVVAGWLDRVDLPGVRIALVDETEPATEPPSPVGTMLLLGERVSLTDAAARAPFALKVPTGETLGAPDEVYLRQVEGGALVSLLYLPRPDLPEVGTTGVGALLMQFQSAQGAELIVKGVLREESLLPVRIGTGDGYWIRDGRLYIAPDPTGDIPVDTGTSRPSGNVLLWQESGVTYRLETALDRAPAVAVAEDLVSLSPTPAVTDRS